MSEELISSINYDESSPSYQRIKKEFKEKIKDRYHCVDYDFIVNYILDYVFQKKATKSQCMEKFNPIFHDKTKLMIDYLCEIINNEENKEDESDSDDSSLYYRKVIRNKRKRERSRSYSEEREKNKFDFDNYSRYPSIKPKGFYPPKGRFLPQSMMPFGLVYSPYNNIPQITPK